MALASGDDSNSIHICSGIATKRGRFFNIIFVYALDFSGEIYNNGVQRLKSLEPNYEVKYHVAARQEARRFLRRSDQYLFCVEQAKLLRFFPRRAGAFEGRLFSLDIKRIEDFWELRVWDKILEHRNIRILFEAFSRPKEIWVLSVYAKKQQKTPLAVKKRCRKRIRMLERQGYRR